MSLSLPIAVAPTITVLPGFATMRAQTGVRRRPCSSAVNAPRAAETRP